MRLEHINMTVSDPKEVAAVFCDLFDWHIRWEGVASDNGYSVHVGDEDAYIALYSPATSPSAGSNTYHTRGGLNHIGIVVADIQKAEARVSKAGFEPRSHADYEPGKRFYFDGPEGVEIEVVSYA